MVDGGDLVEILTHADEFVEAANAHLRHKLAHFFGDVEKVVDDVLWRTLEARAQHRVLGRHAHRTGVEMTLAHHDAARGDQWGGREAHLVGAEQGRDNDIAAGADAAIGLDDDAAAQAVGDERLLGFGQADFPRAAGMLDRGERRGAGASLEARNGDMVGARLGDAGRDRADAHFGNELYRDRSLRVGVAQVVDELGQVLDRVDVVMRRRRDEADARRRIAHPRDGRVDLMAGQLPTFAGLGPLRHLDLDLIGVDQIFGGDAKTAGRDLLDRRAHGIAIGQGREAIRLLAAFAGIGAAADAVHGDGERRVGLAAQGAIGHGSGREAADDLLGGLDIVDGDRRLADLLRAL